jgi:hypothetical protein
MKSYMSKSSTTSWKDCSVFLGLIWAQIYMYIHMRTNECIVYGPCTSWCVLYTWRGGPSQGMLKIISNMGTMGHLWIHHLYIFKHHFFLSQEYLSLCSLLLLLCLVRENTKIVDMFDLFLVCTSLSRRLKDGVLISLILFWQAVDGRKLLDLFSWAAAFALPQVVIDNNK